MERKGFSKIHESKSKKSLRETREYRCLLSSTDAEAARAGTDRYTDTHTHTHVNYRNPRACAPRVNNAQDFFPDSDIQWDQASGTWVVRGKSLTSTTSLLVIFNTETQAPIDLTATYQSTLSVLLEWTFAQPFSTGTSYVVYYQSGGVETFSRSNSTETIHQLNNLPAGGIHSISLVAVRQGRSILTYLPSLVAGPVDPGMLRI